MQGEKRLMQTGLRHLLVNSAILIFLFCIYFEILTAVAKISTSLKQHGLFLTNIDFRQWKFHLVLNEVHISLVYFNATFLIENSFAI